jgi:drug/metabolite transporter (DMT)-like permease
MGSKAAGGTTRGTLRVIIAGHAISLAALLGILLLQHGHVPRGAPLAWGLAAGVAAGLSLTAFYIALARGAMGASAAISGLIAAAIPAVVGVVTEGRPGMLRLAGFALAAGSIWLIAAAGEMPATEQADSRNTSALAIIGGVGFGIYFVALRFANPLGVFEPLALARIGSLVTCFALLAALRPSQAERDAGHRGWLSGRALLWALGIAVLDTAGNAFFVAATRRGRLDVASVLASLYPASTILLAAALLKERPTRRQLLGMGAALAAVVMITV